jgi:Flp pilus assembly protein TadG
MDLKAALSGRLAPLPSRAAAVDPRVPVLRRILASDEAGAAIEFAIVAPVLFALLLGTLQLVLVFLAQASLETACEGSARYVLTGQAQTNFTGTATVQQAAFKTYVCSQLPPYMSCSSLYADVSSGPDYTAVNLAEPTWSYDSNGNVTNTFNYTPGTPGQIAVVRLYYFWPVISLLGFNITSQVVGPSSGTVGTNYDVLIATSVAKTEAY